MRARPAKAAAALLLAATVTMQGASASSPAAGACKGTIYLTFDTGSQSQAALIAETLGRHHIKATFFLANEKTVRGDWSLDPSWAAYWKARAAEGHAFGSHTFDHVYWKRDEAGGRIAVKPQFGVHAGKQQTWTAEQYCGELRRVDARFRELTGRGLDPIFRAPGGHTSPNVLAAANSCGYSHVGWAPAGFSGDETASEAFPNALLLKRALDKLKDGDIFMAHMGIWSRKDPWAPANLEPLISGLEQKGFCFATLREHPDYASHFKK
ncbi:polysaccharide deacetylase family protein [Massilia aerilata]|uniref:Polysaccharide deacetylase family protein n=1 Tax=Massilia aerilata TaxID=453817 RepID=A0ABW0S2X2_9BURK